jgi:asparagine synthase (glutamine-hydrolysing)
MEVVLVPQPGPSFADASPRARPPGAYRIAGTSGALPPDRACRLRAALGETARVLEPRPGALIADVDGLRLAGAPIAPVATEAELEGAVRAGRLAELEGAFAIAWIDDDGALRLARDPIGHRTLYYAVHEGQLVFASRLRALLDAFELPRRLDLRSVAAFLSYAYVPGRATMIEGVSELLPGELLTWRGGTLERASFWELPADPPATGDPTVLRTELRAALEREIRAALPAGAPVCASLSGGIDSSLVVALARRLHDHPVRTFSISFGSDHRNELPFSSLVAAHTGTQHRVVELRPPAILAHLDDTIARMDKPNGDPLTVPNALLFREMSEHGAVVLNGEGGDPCFGGPKNVPMLLAELYGDGDGGDPAYARERSYLRAHAKCFDDLRAMLAPDAYAAACTPPLEHDLAPWFQGAGRPSFVGMLMAINVRFKGGHHILPKVDALSEPFGVLPRSPLFAKSIVELAFRIPSTLKLSGAIEKYLLKEAVRDLLPDTIIDRAKSGMLVPVEGWFQGPLAQNARARLLDGLAALPVFHRPMLEQLLAGKHLGLRPRRGVKIWLLVTLEAHLRQLGVRA